MVRQRLQWFRGCIFRFGFLKALRHHYKIKTLVIVVRKSLKDIVDLYGHAFDHAIYFDSDFPIDSSFSDKFGPGFLICASKAYYLGGGAAIHLQLLIEFPTSIGINWVAPTNDCKNLILQNLLILITQKL